MPTSLIAPFEQPETELRLFAYVLGFTETEEMPDEAAARPGDLRRRAGGGFWIFDGDAWIEW